MSTRGKGRRDRQTLQKGKGRVGEQSIRERGVGGRKSSRKRVRKKERRGLQEVQLSSREKEFQATHGRTGKVHIACRELRGGAETVSPEESAEFYQTPRGEKGMLRGGKERKRGRADREMFGKGARLFPHMKRITRKKGVLDINDRINWALADRVSSF